MFTEPGGGKGLFQNLRGKKFIFGFGRKNFKKLVYEEGFFGRKGKEKSGNF